MITRRQHLSARVVRPRWRAALAALVLACLAPLPAHAEVLRGCQLNPAGALAPYYNESITGASGLPKPLVPELITLDKSNPVGMTIYQKRLPSVPWVCTSSDSTDHPTLVSGNGMNAVLSELRRVGLKLVINIDGYGDWEPANNMYDNRFALGNEVYKTTPFSGTKMITKGYLEGTLKLVVVERPVKPVRAFFLANRDMVRMMASNIVTDTNYLFIGSSNNTAVSLIPPCIAKILTPGSVYLGRVYSVGNLPLPSKKNFTLHADFDESCDDGINVADLDGDILIPLKLMFQPAGNQELTANNEGIVLKNTDGESNGLELRLRQGGSIPVKFNQWVDESTSLRVANHPLPLYYSAELTKSGRPLVSGKFQQQVTVLIGFQ
ncbi:hypothetical protein [Achromobacter xylosoxidans]|uniref:Fimbrial protein n=1 Tax=Alcaligenes xylosoxydans xylosoxydans TaxID=85698 RepID=A0A1R1JYZ7_ALCXX|nr:hypothetical protein [Achromobacter xylosoxidans]OMG92435.1 hypothetical protein BIZ92_07045 [Achromobacter xylosoxidans]BEG75633.1 hypothetical protein HBIAX_02700 [Achromobacter xylosoxidans]